jgi:hypothetical protein
MFPGMPPQQRRQTFRSIHVTPESIAEYQVIMHALAARYPERKMTASTTIQIMAAVCRAQVDELHKQAERIAPLRAGYLGDGSHDLGSGQST